nr:MAG TPA: hypothetical protein [Caudoviricetes sp.]
MRICLYLLYIYLSNLNLNKYMRICKSQKYFLTIYRHFLIFKN